MIRIAGFLAILGLGFAPQILAQEDAEAPAWKLALEEKLESQVSLEFEERSFKEAIESLYMDHGLRVVIDPQFLRDREDNLFPLSLKLNGTSLRNAIEIVTSMVGVSWGIRSGFVVFGTPERLAELPEDFPALPEGASEGARATDTLLRTQPINFTGVDVPWPTFAIRIRDYSREQVRLELSEELLAGRSPDEVLVNIEAGMLGFGHALSVVAWTLGGRIEVGEGVVRFVALEKSD